MSGGYKRWIFSEMGVWMWRFDAEYKQSLSECMEKLRGGNGGQKDLQKTEVKGPGFLCGAS